MRTDTSLIKYLAENIGPEAAAAYNRLPLFIMPDDAHEFMSHEKDLLNLGPEVLPYPFDDFLIDFPFGTSALATALKTLSMEPPPRERGRLWVRVRSWDSIFRDGDPATTVDRDQIDCLKTLSPGLFLEGWEEKTNWAGGLPPYPDYSVIGVESRLYRDFKNYLHLYPNDQCRPSAGQARLFGGDGGWCNIARCVYPGTRAHMICHGSEILQSTMCRLVIISLIYLAQGLGGATTRISWTPRNAREEKTERLKPWVSPRRESYIIIDPVHAREYGHPSGEAVSGPGRHASPVPHARRGHPRRLAGNRITWVRPTWVGAREWQHQGRVYKILMNEG